MIASAVATLPPSLVGAARIFELALRATRDLLRDLSGGPGTDAAPIGWFLALPEEDAVTASWGLASSLGPALFDRLSDLASIVVAARSQGSAGSLAILGDAVAAIRGGAIARAIVVGVDSFIDRDRLSLIDRLFPLCHDDRVSEPLDVTLAKTDF